MRREKRFAEQQQRYLARQEERRLRKMKSNSLPGANLCRPPGADAAPVGERSRRYENQKAGAAKLQVSSHVGSNEPAARRPLEGRGLAQGTLANGGAPNASPRFQ
jgi:hypothetical protein